MNVKDPNSRLMRWRLKLEEYDYEIIYKSGKTNTNADALSRIPINAIDSYMSDEDARRILADILKPEIKIAFHKNPYTGWKNIDPESVSIENLYALILPILEDPNASPTKWTLHFVGPINDEIRRTINDLINIYNLQTKTKIIIEERPTDWFEEIPASVTKEDVPRNPSPIPSSSSRSRPIRNKEIIIKKQVGRQSNKTILFIETPPEVTRENEIYVSPHSTHRQMSIQLHDFLTENDHHLNIIHDQKKIDKLISIIDEYYLGDKLYIYVSQYFP